MSNWNPDYIAEFGRRQKLYYRLQSNKTMIPGFKLHYKNNPVDFIQDWGTTEDPRNVSLGLPTLLPMTMWPKQKEFVEFFKDMIFSKPGTKEARRAVVKARDGGFTWLSCDMGWWMWTFYDRIVFGYGSNKAESVDKIGDPNSIFDKLRCLIRNCPDLFRPKGFDFKKHDKLMTISNPENGSVLVGKAGDDIGMGGRSTVFVNDEKASYQHAESREAALSGNTDHIMDVSTPKGIGNVFYNTVHGGHTPVFWAHWSDDPRKSQEWYNNMKAEYTAKGIAHIFAEQYDLDFAGSVDRVVIPPAWVKAAVDAHLAIGWTETGDIQAGQDISDGGGDLNSLAIRNDNILFYINAHGGEPGRIDKTALNTWKDCVKHKVLKLKFDGQGVGSQFKNELDRIFAENTVKKFEVINWIASGKVVNPWGEFLDNRLNKDMFENAKAQAYWDLRIRFYKTFMMRNGEAEYPTHELISISSGIPHIGKLLNQLSQPTFEDSKHGKILINKTPEGTSSPDIAESVMICFAPVEKFIPAYTS